MIRYDLQIQVVEMDILVAPTVINLENPTFWISNSGQFIITENLSKEPKNQERPSFSSDKDQYKK